MKTEEAIKNLQREIEKIKVRNKHVEADKTWETSLLRRLTIAIVTYILVVIFLFSIQNNEPFLNAIIPACAYLISTLTLNIIKNWWLKRRKE